MTPARRAFGLPPVRPGPVPGYVLIADRNNNRLLLVSPSKHVEWRFPGPSAAYGAFRDPDDAFFTPGYRQIVVNQEFNETVVRINPQQRRIVWSYGRPGVAGSGSGELSNPDDAYVLPNGDVRVADIQNCRVVKLSPAHHIVGEIGTAGACAHDPPRTLLSPNGDTPLPGGGMLVTEIGGYVDRLDAHGRLVYSLHTPTSYPSDAQLLPNGNILVAGFDTPGRIDELTPSGKVVWTYGPTSGPGSLDRPSLAVRWPNGMIAATDDWHHRIVVIDPHTKRIVWQYGHFGVASSALGYLSKPDGLDLLPAGRPLIRPRAARSRLHITRIGSLPRLPHACRRSRCREDGFSRRAGWSRPALPHRCSPVALGHSPGSARCPRRSTMPQRPGSARTSTSSAAASRARPTGSAGSTRGRGRRGRPGRSVSRFRTSARRAWQDGVPRRRLHRQAVRHGDPRLSAIEPCTGRRAIASGSSVRGRGSAGRKGLRRRRPHNGR